MPFATHILVPTDFSHAAELAVEATARLATQLGAKVTLVHVHDPDALRPPASLGYSHAQQESMQSEIERAAEKGLQDLRAGALKDVEDLEMVILHDPSPAHAICAYAKKIGADLIVIATHGRTGLKHLLIGSVAERVVRHAPCPVLSLRSTKAD
ncbi:MAG: universal stress protein [Sandaracinaceae bacterium]|nr:universal stress protein [Sandaracinaceae bacterium]